MPALRHPKGCRFSFLCLFAFRGRIAKRGKKYDFDQRPFSRNRELFLDIDLVVWYSTRG